MLYLSNVEEEIIPILSLLNVKVLSVFNTSFPCENAQ